MSPPKGAVDGRTLSQVSHTQLGEGTCSTTTEVEKCHHHHPTISCHCHTSTVQSVVFYCTSRIYIIIIIRVVESCTWYISTCTDFWNPRMFMYVECKHIVYVILRRIDSQEIQMHAKALREGWARKTCVDMRVALVVATIRSGRRPRMTRLVAVGLFLEANDPAGSIERAQSLPDVCHFQNFVYTIQHRQQAGARFLPAR